MLLVFVQYVVHQTMNPPENCLLFSRSFIYCVSLSTRYSFYQVQFVFSSDIQDIHELMGLFVGVTESFWCAYGGLRDAQQRRQAVLRRGFRRRTWICSTGLLVNRTLLAKRGRLMHVAHASFICTFLLKMYSSFHCFRLSSIYTGKVSGLPAMQSY